MKKIILHLGAHKTGTTSCQRELLASKALLEEKKMSLIVETATIRGGKDVSFLMSDEYSDYLRGIFSQRLDQGFETVVYSYEGNLGNPFPLNAQGGIYPQGKTGIQLIEKATQGLFDERKILFSVRKPSDFIESYYLQIVKEGNAITFPEFMRRFLSLNTSWKELLTHLGESFGYQNVDLVNYSDGRKTHDFEEILGLKLVKPGVEHNPSYGQKAVGIALHVLPKLSTPKQKQKLRTFLTEVFSDGEDTKGKYLYEREKRVVDSSFQKDLQWASQQFPSFAISEE